MVKNQGRDIILDTHILIYLLNGDPRLKRKAILTRIRERSKFGNIYLSAITISEMGKLQEEGRVELMMGLDEWFAKALSDRAMTLVPVSSEIAAKSTHFLGAFNNIYDATIVATAHEMGLSLASMDKNMVKIAKKHFIPIL